MKDNTIQIRMSAEELERLNKAVCDTIGIDGKMYTRADIIRLGLILYYEALEEALNDK